MLGRTIISSASWCFYFECGCRCGSEQLFDKQLILPPVRETGLVNLSLALNMDRQTIVDYQARIESDPDTVTTVVKTKTAAEIKKLQVHGRELGKKYGPFYGPIYGQAIFESKRSIFAEGGASTSIVTENDDKLLVLYYYMFSLHDEGKWETIAFYMGKFDGHQCHDRMRTLLLQQNSYGRIRNPTTLLQQQF